MSERTNLKVEDFDLSKEELTTIVEGAQKFMAPQADDNDSERVNS